MNKKILTFIIAIIAFFGVIEAADAAANLFNRVIISEASEPMTMLALGTILVLGASFMRKSFK